MFLKCAVEVCKFDLFTKGSRKEKKPCLVSRLIYKRSLPAEISEFRARLLVWERERSLARAAGSHSCKWWGTQFMFWQGKDNHGSPFPLPVLPPPVYLDLALSDNGNTESKAFKDELFI